MLWTKYSKIPGLLFWVGWGLSFDECMVTSQMEEDGWPQWDLCTLQMCTGVEAASMPPLTHQPTVDLYLVSLMIKIKITVPVSSHLLLKQAHSLPFWSVLWGFLPKLTQMWPSFIFSTQLLSLWIWVMFSGSELMYILSTFDPVKD